MRRVMPLEEGMNATPFIEETQLPSPVSQQLTLELPVDNSFALKDSFNSLREINNNLSKNC
jgi:hypothetical protein